MRRLLNIFLVVWVVLGLSPAVWGMPTMRVGSLSESYTACLAGHCTPDFTFYDANCYPASSPNDRFEDGPNTYDYVGQNPWTKFDPEGLKTIGDYDEQANGDQWQIDQIMKTHAGTKQQYDAATDPEAKRKLAEKYADEGHAVAWLAYDKAMALEGEKNILEVSAQFNYYAQGYGVKERIDPYSLNDNGTDGIYNNARDFRNSVNGIAAGVAYFGGKWLNAGASRLFGETESAVASQTLTKAERLNKVFAKLKGMPGAKNAEEAMAQMNNTLNEVEDAHSGVASSTPASGKVASPRMYPPQADSIATGADGGMTATSRGHVTTYGTDGSITVKDAGGNVVFQKAGGG